MQHFIRKFSVLIFQIKLYLKIQLYMEISVLMQHLIRNFSFVDTLYKTESWAQTTHFKRLIHTFNVPFTAYHTWFLQTQLKIWQILTMLTCFYMYICICIFQQTQGTLNYITKNHQLCASDLHIRLNVKYTQWAALYLTQLGCKTQ